MKLLRVRADDRVCMFRCYACGQMRYERHPKSEGILMHDTAVAAYARDLALVIEVQANLQDYRQDTDQSIELRLSFEQVAFLIAALREYGAQQAK